MDVRVKVHLLAETEAIRRQNMANIAQATAAGMSDKEGFKRFISNLELDHSRVDNINTDREALGLPPYKEGE